LVRSTILSRGGRCDKIGKGNLNFIHFMNYTTIKKEKVISVPAVFFKRFYGLAKTFSVLSEEMEDFLSSFDEKKINQLKRARKEHLQGKIKPLSTLS